MIDLPQLLQRDIEARLNASANFADVAIVRVEPGDQAQTVLQKLAATTSKSGKLGLAVLVLQIEDSADHFVEIPDGPLDYLIALQVVEQPELNRQANGTKKPGRIIAREVHRVLKHFTPVGFTHNFIPDEPAIEQVVYKDSNLRVWQVNFTAREADTECRQKTPRVRMIPPRGAAASVQLFCDAAAAVIYYTLDGTYPWSGNSTATLYTAPITLPSGATTLRAGAHVTDQIDSDISEADFTN